MAITSNKKLLYAGCGVLAVLGVVLVGLFIAVLMFARNAPSYGSCNPVREPRSRTEVTPYPGAAWVDGESCGGFFSATESHLYVSSDDPSLVIPYYQEQMEMLAQSLGTELHHNAPNQFTISVTTSSSYRGVGVTISDTPPDGWKVDKKTKAASKTYIVVSTSGGIS